MPYTAEDILYSPHIRPVGMLYDVDDLHAMYMFQHETPDCQTSFCLDVEELREFVREPIPQEKRTLEKDCESHCVSLNDLSECKQECYFAPYRRLLLQMLAFRKNSQPAEK